MCFNAIVIFTIIQYPTACLLDYLKYIFHSCVLYTHIRDFWSVCFVAVDFLGIYSTILEVYVLQLGTVCILFNIYWNVCFVALYCTHIFKVIWSVYFVLGDCMYIFQTSWSISFLSVCRTHILMVSSSLWFLAVYCMHIFKIYWSVCL